ncbi:hypothetical protein GLOIN_2v1124436 [Rhizophagus clarus]|uniref:Crinkler effector protein N-terminal domain-containing protein n=1 Tax=Rhizophagus clarus TaxID=94130 RepID=A0A8H3LHA8_9GLOM|nr:hypothetical protein GLOIN_2v1124436 [Rhizophagus clarus]
MLKIKRVCYGVTSTEPEIKKRHLSATSITSLCLVKGNKTTNVLPVDIDKDQLVEHLKEVINAKKQNKFAGRTRAPCDKRNKRLLESFNKSEYVFEFYREMNGFKWDVDVRDRRPREYICKEYGPSVSDGAAILKHLARFKSIPINGDDQMKHQNRICLLVTCRRATTVVYEDERMRTLGHITLLLVEAQEPDSALDVGREREIERDLEKLSNIIGDVLGAFDKVEKNQHDIVKHLQDIGQCLVTCNLIQLEILSSLILYENNRLAQRLHGRI